MSDRLVPTGRAFKNRIKKWSGSRLSQIEELSRLKEAHAMYDSSAYRTQVRRKSHLDDFDHFCQD
ncbi:hypothetical protein J1614_006932 [Plenodomus biglobosus]|nr:hypothetical protein J1614_006932 [Plenodomus biglobosus]